MSEPHRTTRPATSGRPRFDERLSAPLWWYPFALGIGAMFGAEIHMGYPGIRSWIGYVVLIPLAVIVVWRLGSARVRVTDDALLVSDGRLPLANVGRVQIVPKADKQIALGPELDPNAYVMHRPWIGPVLRIENTEPGAAAPYWVVSSRRPEELVKALGR